MNKTCALLSLSMLLSWPSAVALAKPAGHAAPPHVATHQAADTGKMAAIARSAPPATAAKGKPCYAKPVQLMRVRGAELEPREVSLTTCSGTPNPSALDSISVLGRPRDVERPMLPEIHAYRALPVPKGKASKNKRYRDPAFVTERVMRLNPGLLVRLQKIAKHYPGRVIEIISGYRPDARETSRHHHGMALDLRVAGVRRERLRDYLRTFEDTGVGYYPNSFFVHMDVREGKGFWVDRSGPGEPADYGPWPLTPRGVKPSRGPVLRAGMAQLDQLRAPLAKQAAANGTQKVRVLASARSKESDDERDEMNQDEVRRAREEARHALEALRE